MRSKLQQPGAIARTAVTPKVRANRMNVECPITGAVSAQVPAQQHSVTPTPASDLQRLAAVADIHSQAFANADGRKTQLQLDFEKAMPHG